MPSNSKVRTSAGSTLGIVATAPATYTEAGFAALSFVLVGEITDFGEFGREYAKVDHKAVGRRRVVKRKGSFDDGGFDLQIGRDVSDAGQILLKAAANSDASYSYCMTLQDGTKYYFSAQAMSFKTKVGGVDDITTISVKLEIDDDIIEDLTP